MPAQASLQRKAPAATRTPTLSGTTTGSVARAAPGSASASAAAHASLVSSESKARAGDESPLRGRARAFPGLLGLSPSVDNPWAGAKGDSSYQALALSEKRTKAPAAVSKHHQSVASPGSVRARNAVSSVYDEYECEEGVLQLPMRMGKRKRKKSLSTAKNRAAASQPAEYTYLSPD
ncbi:hypothetical protein GQ54DRAFT_314878 [Martensiomyces pterosporus]|nr:hypothetical protein GQ54DRAFT_314878 [Martensiomyces pterosporus]